MNGSYYSGYSTLWKTDWFDSNVENAIRFDSYEEAKEVRTYHGRDKFMFTNSTIEEVKENGN
jgi:hypothetical protein